MSAFTPTISNLEPPDRPDNLSSAVLHSLSRPIYGRIAWGPLKSFILGGITFGILPLIRWPKAFSRFVIAEQQQFWHLLEWLNIRTGDQDAAKLRDSIQDTGATATIWIVPTILLVILAFNFLPWLGLPGFDVRHLFDTTYGVSFWPGDPFPSRHFFHHSSAWSHLFKIWTLCLCLGYFSHWLHVRQHASNVNQFLSRLNLILARQHLPPVPLYGIGIGLRPVWLVAGFIGLGCGAIWAIPAALAGAVHQRYCRRTSTRIRGELALRVSAALNRQRPPINVPIPNGFRIVCRNQLCGKPLAPGAAFCSRCGTRVPSPDAVA
jgi:hypothetical protein